MLACAGESAMNAITIRRAELSDLDALVPLFDAYRMFYEQPSDPAGAAMFLRERFELGESVILIALDAAGAVGFTQLYPAFSSVRMRRLFLLNDLFVHARARGQRLGERLLAAAADHGRAAGCVRLVLTTAVTNAHAQALYERTGWVRDTHDFTYELAL
jgi:GNAT superfamily N-acetyltransferase